MHKGLERINKRRIVFGDVIMSINLHGHTVVLEEEIIDADKNVIVEKGSNGLVTAYLPDMKRFAIMFTDDRWLTFTETEEAFNKRVKVI